MPSVDTELNDIPGTLPLGRYIESVAVGVGIEVVPPSTDESDSGKAADAYSTGVELAGKATKVAGEGLDNMLAALDSSGNIKSSELPKGIVPSGTNTTDNQLANKEFVNSSVATNTATYRGSFNLVTDLSLTTSATHEQVAAAIALKLASLVPPVVPDNNDYCFALVPTSSETPTEILRVDRYKFVVSESGGTTTRAWEYEFTLNNSSFTAEQWASINSGITAADVSKLAGIAAGAQVNVIETVKVNGTPIVPEGKAVNVVAATPADATLTERGPNHDGFSAWTIKRAGVDVTSQVSQPEYLGDIGGGIYSWQVYVIAGDEGQPRVDKSEDWPDAISLSWLSSGGTYTATRTALQGYQLGAQTDKPVASEAEADSLRNGKLDKSGGDLTGELRSDSDIITSGEVDGLLFWATDSQGNHVEYAASFIGFYPNGDSSNYTLSLPRKNGILALLADTMRFSETVAYAVGDVCFYNGSFYRCTTAHDAGAWNASHFTEVIGGLSTGTPTAPTPTAGDSSTKVATTAFVASGIRYTIVTPETTTSTETSGGTTSYVRHVALTDRAMNSVTQGTDGDSHPITEVELTFPDATDNTKVRDFSMILTCDQAEVPEISLASFLTIYMEGGADINPEAGVNVYSFTEFEHNKFIASRKTIEAAMTNLPVTGDQLAVQAGVPDAQDFGDIQTALDLADTATVQDAVDAAMQL